MERQANPAIPLRLANRVALITGGTSGIGLATAKRFLSEGARVVITGVEPSRLTAATEELGGDTLGVVGDVRDIAALRALARRVSNERSGLDVLFANAGVAFATPLAETDEQRFDACFDVNVRGVFLTVQQCAPLLRARASVVLNTSWLNEVGSVGLSVLSASKAAVRSLTRTLAAELAPRGVRVNAVSPGAIDTPIYSKTGMSPEDLRAFAARLQNQIPLGRFGTADEVAAVVAFLASDDSRYMLGAEVAVDGGFSQL